MKVVYSPDHKLHAPATEIYDGVPDDYAETPERIENIKAALEERGDEIIPPRNFDDVLVTSVHFANYVQFLAEQSAAITPEEGQRFASYHIMDSYAPMTSGTFRAARTAANVALTTMQEVVDGNPAYGLCRPPGHHAETATMGGYCYFNNAAIAANELANGARVAVLDIDYHHGNGTQEIFYDRDDVLYVSLHADVNSNFPYNHGQPENTGNGEGEGYNMNIVVEKDADVQSYLAHLGTAVDRIQGFAPDYTVLSLGFDTYQKDPIAGFDLAIGDYAKIGGLVGTIETPTVIIQEGGYYVADLGKLAVNFIAGFEGKKA